MRSYLEHGDRSREVIERALQKLKPDGVVFVHV
jgi:2-polyprenyl-3-methyl-5-hydroxy-6-metoxy-1,4-benzoquinol methylase